MSGEEFTHNGVSGYVALPEGGTGPGVLVLHAWWGLNGCFKQVCDRLAAAGYVAVAPDLFGGAIAVTVDQAQHIVDGLDFGVVQAQVNAACAFLRAHPAVRGSTLGVVGFSLGASRALTLAGTRPNEIGAVVVFYGTGHCDAPQARAAFLGHYADNDPWEPAAEVRQLEAELHAAGRAVTFYTYPHTGHWFFEDDRPDAYDPEAAQLAWQRTLSFLDQHLR